MASARRTGTNENVSTYGVARDYSVLATWESDTDNNLAADLVSEALECFDDAASFNDSVSLSGATTNTTYFRIIRPAAGQGHDGTSNNGVFFSTTANASVFNVSESDVHIQDLILKTVQNSVDNRIGVQVNTTRTGNEIVGCIALESSNSGAGTNRGFYGLGTSVFALCLAEANENSGFLTVTGTNYFYNCTSVGNSGIGIWALTGTTHAKNCISDTNGGVEYSGTFATATNCASSDASSPDTGRRNKTFTYVNAAGNDYHLSASDTGAKDDGASLAADAIFAFDDDIDKQLFSTWDIGFDENSPPAVGHPTMRRWGGIPHMPALTGRQGW